MAVNGKHPTEETRLILPPVTEISPEAITEAEEGQTDHDIPNQFVGTLRAVLIILSLWMLIFLQASNMSGLTTTSSAIADDLDAYSEANWFTSVYLIALSSCSPLVGSLSQLFSPRSCVFVSAILFSIGGFVTAQAPSTAVFLIGRAISGMGGAGILTISIILVLELTTKKRRGLFIGLVNAGYTSGVALGAVIAGSLLPVTGWRFLFLIQTPLGLVAGAGVYFSIPHHFVSGPQSGKKEPLSHKLAQVDYLGAGTLNSSIILFLYGLASPRIQWIPIVASAFLITAFVLNELYLAKKPIIPITVLKSRGALLSCFAQLGFMSVRWMVLFYTPAYAIAVRGWSPGAAGTILIPTNFGFALGGLIAGAFHIRRTGSFYLPSLISYLCFSVSLFILGRISTLQTPVALYAFVCFANGVCTGAALNYTLAHVLHLTLPETHFIATSLLATFRTFAGSFGSAIGGGFFLRVLQSSLKAGFKERHMKGEGELIRKLLGSPALVNTLVGAEKDVAMIGYMTGLQTLFLAGSGVALLMVVVQSGTGWKYPVQDLSDDTENEEDEENEDSH